MKPDTSRLFAPDFDQENGLYDFYQQMLEDGQPYWMPHQGEQTPGSWLFSRYHQVIQVLKLQGPISKQVRKVYPEAPLGPIDFTMMNSDPPDHTRLRGAVSRFFSSDAVAALEPRINALVDQLIDELLDQKEVDFIQAFAVKLPVTIISEIIGVPADDRRDFHLLANQFKQALDSTKKTAEIFAKQREAFMQMNAYFIDLFERRRQHPEDDLVSYLLELEKRGELSHDEALVTGSFLMMVGYETTISMIGSGMLLLVREQDVWSTLRSSPELVPSAVEEMMRYESPFQRSSYRIVTADCEIDGFSLKRGEQVTAMIGAANRDPARFDQPEFFNIRREPNRHLAFGAGLHACLGAILARAELRISFESLLKRSKQVDLIDYAWKPDSLIRSMDRLVLRFN